MGQLGKAYGGEESKITFRFLYWGLINQKRNYRRRNNLGGNNDFFKIMIMSLGVPNHMAFLCLWVYLVI